MARPYKQRRVCELPATSTFVPNTLGSIETVEMAIDEYEVIRLIDHLKLTQNECAQQMNVARTTVQAMYDSARSKMADAIVNGKKLVIKGGNYSLCSEASTCCGKNCAKRRCLNGQCKNHIDSCLNCSKEDNHDNI